MDARPWSTVGRLVPCCEPSVLIVQSHANCLETLPYTMSIQHRAVVEKAVQDIQEMDRVCDRTVRQVESSLRILEDSSRQFETDVSDCALRMAGLL